jgi:hypothetical protein
MNPSTRRSANTVSADDQSTTVNATVMGYKLEDDLSRAGL